MWNLIRILKNDQCLEGLNSINEVYDSQVNLLEEVLQYHKMKENINNDYKSNFDQSIKNEEELKTFDINQVFMTHNIIDKN